MACDEITKFTAIVYPLLDNDPGLVIYAEAFLLLTWIFPWRVTFPTIGALGEMIHHPSISADDRDQCQVYAPSGAKSPQFSWSTLQSCRQVFSLWSELEAL